MSTTILTERAPPIGAPSVRHAGRGLFLPVLVQLCLVLLVIHEYQLETRAFFHIALLAVGGFAIHSVLPRAHRLGFFVLLSFAAILVVFGVADALWLIVAGCALIGLCHLPVPFGVRVLLVLGLGAVLSAARAGVLPTPASEAVWPILGSMFMFRLALYLHALRHDRERPAVARTLAYFFMLPNVVFPLFPVVDYTTFGRTYYDRDERTIHDTGVQWIVRGIVHLILYRLVYRFVVLDPADVANLGDLARSMLGVFLLYLRVSGSFHLIIGMLHLFGFRLPETHHLYYLASSFTDFWRRINIYWKDFMMKLVYYPSFFRLRRWGVKRALVASTIIVFASTWLLHSYQWFWLRGGFPITVPDVLFWGILGALVVANSLREMRRGRDRSPARRRWDPKLALRTVAMFTTICVLWSLWSAESLIVWLWMLRSAAIAEPVHIAAVGSLLVVGLLIAGVPWDTVAGARSSWLARHSALARSVAMLVLLVLAQPAIIEPTAPRLAATMQTLTRSSLNTRDVERQVNGYYENLDGPSRMSLQRWGADAERPATWVGLSATGVVRQRDDFIGWDLLPSRQVVWNDRLFTTNRWGMRDRDYTLAKPERTVRIALLGPSHAMGSNVLDHEVFETLVEDRLNRDLSPATGLRYEILNFAVAGYGVTQDVALLEDRVFGFDPDIVVFVVAMQGLTRVASSLVGAAEKGHVPPDSGVQKLFEMQGLSAAAARGLPVPFHPLRRLAARVGLSVRMPWQETQLRVREIAEEAMVLSVARGARLAQAHGVPPVLVVLDLVGSQRDDPSRLITAAEQHDATVFNLLDVYEGHDMAALTVAPWDTHPNARGHQVIADRLYRELTESPMLNIADHRADRALPADLPQE